MYSEKDMLVLKGADVCQSLVDSRGFACTIIFHSDMLAHPVACKP